MNTIEEETTIEKNNNNQNKRKTEKYQTFLPKNLNFFHKFEKDKRKTALVKNIQENQKDKKKMFFSDKKIDQIFIKTMKDSIIHTSVFELLGIKERSRKNYDI